MVFSVRLKCWRDQHGNLLDRVEVADESGVKGEIKLPPSFSIPFDAKEVADRKPCKAFLIIDKE